MGKPRPVAVLYADPRGPYPSIEGVDVWDEERDARFYEGPHPVVAHPPCGPWGHMLRFCGPRLLAQKPLATLAIAQVRRWGGVLEHPVGSGLWRAPVNLPRPTTADQLDLVQVVDEHGGFSVRLNQVAWGHACLKPTLLYCVGVPYRKVVRGLRRGGSPTHAVAKSTSRAANPCDRLLAASAEIRRRTPLDFAGWLVDLARSAEVAG